MAWCGARWPRWTRSNPSRTGGSRPRRPRPREPAAPDATALLERVRNRAAVFLTFEQGSAPRTQRSRWRGPARASGAPSGARSAPTGTSKHQAGRPLQRQPARPRPLLLRCVGDHADQMTAALAGAPELAAAAASARVRERHAGGHAGRARGPARARRHGLLAWEVDCHLFNVPPRQQAVLLGHEHAWREQLAAALRGAARWLEPAAAAPGGVAPGRRDRSMDFDDSPAEATFRFPECRAWLSANARPKPRADALFGPDLTPAQRMQAARDWQVGALEMRAPSLAPSPTRGPRPSAASRRHADPGADLAPGGSRAASTCPPGVFNVSLGMVNQMPAVLAHACDEVRAARIAPALSGEHLWCHGC